jgi:hypothetical protein
MQLQAASVLLFLGIAPEALAQPPYLGAWTADYANSDRDEVVWEFVDLKSGLWDFRENGRHLVHFRIDDDHECSDCASEPWRTLGPNTWDTGWQSPSGLGDIASIAPDGETLSWTSRNRGSEGDVSTRFVRAFARVSGGPGLAGQWRSETERSGLAPAWIEVGPGVDEWLVVELGSTDHGTVCVLLPDGADYPCFTPLVRAQHTAAVKITAARALEVVMKREGEISAEWTLEVSLDGTTMTQTRRSASGRTIDTLYRRRPP